MENAIVATLGNVLPSGEASIALEPQELDELHAELELVARDVLRSKLDGVTLPQAVNDPTYAALQGFHLALRDALLLEIPSELQPFVQSLANRQNSAGRQQLERFGRNLIEIGSGDDPTNRPNDDEKLQAALSELLLFEALRLHLLVASWSSIEFESLGGDEQSVDDIAWSEVEFLLRDRVFDDPSLRPFPLLAAAGHLAMTREANERAEALRFVSEDTREELRMKARLRATLRQLRLPESVLLENALSVLLDGDRHELPELQAQHPLALEGMSRQAMDQRVSRGRRALKDSPERWPTRRSPSLFDLLRSETSQGEARQAVEA